VWQNIDVTVMIITQVRVMIPHQENCEFFCMATKSSLGKECGTYFMKKFNLLVLAENEFKNDSISLTYGCLCSE
jgi:hypothetical protein